MLNLFAELHAAAAQFESRDFSGYTTYREAFPDSENEIAGSEPAPTTVMMKNISCRSTAQDMESLLNQVGLHGWYESVYVPCRHSSKKKPRTTNFGYAFVKFVHVSGVFECHKRLNRQGLKYGPSIRTVEVLMANHQDHPGKKRCPVQHLLPPAGEPKAASATPSEADDSKDSTAASDDQKGALFDTSSETSAPEHLQSQEQPPVVAAVSHLPHHYMVEHVMFLLLEVGLGGRFELIHLPRAGLGSGIAMVHFKSEEDATRCFYMLQGKPLADAFGATRLLQVTRA